MGLFTPVNRLVKSLTVFEAGTNLKFPRINKYCLEVFQRLNTIDEKLNNFQNLIFCSTTQAKT
jgi:hypothetical protein